MTSLPIMKHLWSVGCWIAISVLVALTVAALHYLPRADGELRGVIESRLADAYPQLKIRLGGARWLGSDGVQLDSLTLMKPADPDTQTMAKIAHVDVIRLQGNLSLAALVQGRVSVGRVTLDGVTLELDRNRDGTWAYHHLIPAHSAGSGPTVPEVAIRNGTLHLRDRSQGPLQTVSLDAVNLRLRAQPKNWITEGRVVRDGVSHADDLLIAIDGSYRSSFCERGTSAV